MPYLVTAALVLAKDKQGRVHHRYHGEIIDWLNDEQRTQWLEMALVEEITETRVEAINLAEARRQRAADGTEAERVRQCMDVIDQLDLPLSAGAPTVRAALRERGHQIANDTIASAVKQRRELSRTAGMPAYPGSSDEMALS